jgi:hypothetical protein
MLRNVSALFTVAVALLTADGLTAGVCHEVHGCYVYAPGRNCAVDSNGSCQDNACKPCESCNNASRENNEVLHSMEREARRWRFAGISYSLIHGFRNQRFRFTECAPHPV